MNHAAFTPQPGVSNLTYSSRAAAAAVRQLQEALASKDVELTYCKQEYGKLQAEYYKLAEVAQIEEKKAQERDQELRLEMAEMKDSFLQIKTNMTESLQEAALAQNQTAAARGQAYAAQEECRAMEYRLNSAYNEQQNKIQRLQGELREKELQIQNLDGAWQGSHAQASRELRDMSAHIAQLEAEIKSKYGEGHAAGREESRKELQGAMEEQVKRAEAERGAAEQKARGAEVRAQTAEAELAAERELSHTRIKDSEAALQTERLARKAADEEAKAQELARLQTEKAMNHMHEDMQVLQTRAVGENRTLEEAVTLVRAQRDTSDEDRLRLQAQVNELQATVHQLTQQNQSLTEQYTLALRSASAAEKSAAADRAAAAAAAEQPVLVVLDEADGRMLPVRGAGPAPRKYAAGPKYCPNCGHAYHRPVSGPTYHIAPVASTLRPAKLPARRHKGEAAEESAGLDRAERASMEQLLDGLQQELLDLDVKHNDQLQQIKSFVSDGSTGAMTKQREMSTAASAVVDAMCKKGEQIRQLQAQISRATRRQ